MANKIIIIIECDKARKNTMKSISSIKIHQKWSAREREQGDREEEEKEEEEI